MSVGMETSRLWRGD